MKIFHFFSATFIIVAIVFYGIIPVLATDAENPILLEGNISNTTESETLLDFKPNSTSNDETEDNTSAFYLMKAMKSDLVFESEESGEGGVNISGSSDEIVPDETADEIVNETQEAPVQVTTQYDTLGDIIKAQDWKALSEYNCKMKTDNPELFKDNSEMVPDRQGRWKSYFYSPPALSSDGGSCCG
jgi:hypothetical protein